MKSIDTTLARWLLALAVGLSFSSCRLVSSIGRDASADLPYGKDTQLAYFTGQDHLLKGDFEDAYASFLKCADAEPDEVAFHYQLGKIDLQLERYEAAEHRPSHAHAIAASPRRRHLAGRLPLRRAAGQRRSRRQRRGAAAAAAAAAAAKGA